MHDEGTVATIAAPGRLPGHYRVLVVDDNPDGAQSVGRLLEMMGHEARVARDGTEALTTIESFKPEIVLLDIGLPGLSGYEVARRIREQPGGTSMVLVALTGWGQAEDRRRSREAGLDLHWVKPVNARALAKLLK